MGYETCVRVPTVLVLSTSVSGLAAPISFSFVAFLRKISHATTLLCHYPRSIKFSNQYEGSLGGTILCGTGTLANTSETRNWRVHAMDQAILTPSRLSSCHTGWKDPFQLLPVKSNFSHSLLFATRSGSLP
jgi:hypothetical protein